MKNVKNIFLAHQIERFSDVKLEEECWGLVSMKLAGKVSYVHEVIMDASLLDEGTLGVGDEVVHIRDILVASIFVIILAIA